MTAQSDGNPQTASGSNGPVIYYGNSSRPAASADSGSGSGIKKAAFASADSIRSGLSYEAGDTVSVNFENADIKTVAKVIFGDFLNANYTIDPNVTGVINLSTRRPVQKKQVLWLIETALKAQGAIIVRQGDLYRIAPAGDLSTSGNVSFGRDDRSPGYGITVLPLENISADALNKILDGFGAPPGAMHIDTSRNLLIVKGTASERDWVIDTALAFDVDWMRRQSVGIFPVKNGSPEVLINELNQMADSSVVRFQPITRMNAVLAVSNSPQVINQVSTWIARLDHENGYGPQAHIYRVKYGDAKKLAAVLKEIFLGASSSNLSGGEQIAPNNSPVTASAPATQLASTAAGTQKISAAPSEQKMAEPDMITDPGASASRMRITADPTDNVIVVYASQKDYPRVERALVELDKPPLQVDVEVIVAEVTLNDTLNYGVQYYLQHSVGGFAQVTTANTSTLTQTAATIAQAMPGFSAFLGSSSNPKLVLNALRDVTNVKVLSSPSLVVLDNQPAILQVGDQVPVTTASAQSTVTSGAPLVNTYSYVDTGIILRVTPHINRGSDIRLDVEQEVSQVSSTDSSAASLTPTISQRKMKSTISVGNGQTVLLAGLISQQRSSEKSGVPGLVDIPLLGNLGSNSNNSATRTEIIVFVKAQLIRNASDARHVAEGLRKRMPGFADW